MFWLPRRGVKIAGNDRSRGKNGIYSSFLFGVCRWHSAFYFGAGIVFKRKKMNEITKEVTLPIGYGSWLQVAMTINNSTSLKECSGHEIFTLHICDEKDSQDGEVFEIDVETLKSMVFSELIDLIPGPYECGNIIRSLKRMKALVIFSGALIGEDPTFEKAINHFEKIEKLTRV